MTGIRLMIAALAILSMLAPLAAAAADSGNEDATHDVEEGENAWVEDCPPDMMCAFDAGDDNVTRGPEDCEFCRYGPDDCIDCSGPNTPVDNTTWGTDCPPDVWCFGAGDGPSEAPVCEGGACEYDEIPAGSDSDVGEATLGFVALVGVLVGVGVVVVARRRA